MTDLLADLVLLCHLAFILFVIFGGLLLWYSGKVIYLHIPAVVWGMSLEFFGWICPLTPLENRLRQMGTGSGYEEGFIAHYLMPVIYPDGLTRNIQIVLGILVLLINITVYSWYILHGRNRPLKKV